MLRLLEKKLMIINFFKENREDYDFLFKKIISSKELIYKNIDIFSYSCMLFSNLIEIIYNFVYKNARSHHIIFT